MKNIYSARESLMKVSILASCLLILSTNNTFAADATVILMRGEARAKMADGKEVKVTKGQDLFEKFCENYF
jgi:hypothetical protein